MQDMHADVHYAVELELPSGGRVLVSIQLPSGPDGKPAVSILAPGGRLLRTHQPSRAGMMSWLAINLPNDEDLLLTRAAVSKKTGLSIARLKELEKEDPTYPKKQVFRSTRRVGFWLSEVRAWMKNDVGPEPDPPRRRSRTR